MMDYTRSTSGTGEDNTGIPDDLRCKRSDGKQWRCTAMSMPDKTVCEKHYIQAKKRAANSALRASMKKAKRKSLGESDIYLESKSDDMDLPVVSPEAEDYPVSISGKKYKEKLPKTQVGYSPETPSVRKSYQKLSNDGQQRDVTQYEESMRSYKTTPPSGRESSRSRSHKIDDDDSATTDISEGNSDSSDGTDGQTCHQCRRNDRDGVAWCLLCDRRGYCDSCISTWYSALSLEEIQSVCPACRGICNCRACLRGDNFIKVKIREIPVQEKMEYLYCLLGSVLPVVKRIHHDQYSEVEIERRLRGNEIDLARTKLNVDEQMCCDSCRTPIIDYHRHCMNCSYDVCLSCCQDLRQNLSKFSDWKVESDGNIPCPPKEYGGCGCSSLTLKRIFKMNWVARLVKNVEEMVSGCKTYDAGSQQKTGSNFRLCQFADRDNVDDNFLYCPSSQDVNTEGIGDFRKHWIRGEPVIVKEVCDVSSMSSWDPMVIWRGIRETAEEKLKDDNRIVKALNCLDWSEVEIELGQFIKGYSEGRIHENGWPEMLKLKNWPSPSSFEEFLLYQRPEFINKLPLLEYIHSKWGLLNVAAKLPNYSLQNDAGPKIIISYGTYEELRRGNSVNNLCFSMRDTVHLLVHTCKVKLEGLQRAKIQKVQKAFEESLRDPKISSNSIKDELVDDEGIITNYTVEEKADNWASRDAFEENCPGALWDVFRREDVAKLIEYFRVYWKEFGMPENLTNDNVPRPLYDGLIFLNSHHKRKLKEEFRVEPWSFEQHLGQAVFIPAGCPFQVRNLQSTVQLGLDFLSPESLGEAVRLAEEIRGLPNDHDAKVQMLEVGKISLYAASSAIKEVQKLVLDTKLGAELGFEDPNLTAFVLDNLEKMVKRRQISCMN